MAGWESIACALCGGTESGLVLDIPCPEAPGGRTALRQCSACGLRRLDPRPDSGLIGRYYENAGGQNYNAYQGRRRSPSSQALWDVLRDGASRPAGQPIWSRMLSPLTGAIARWAFDINVPLDRRTDRAVLEVGSGYGDILIYLRSRQASVLGTDLSPSACAKAAEYGVEVRHGTLKQLALPSASFDSAIMCHSLEHVPDPNEELSELARILRPGGTLHIAVPNGAATRLRLFGLRFAHLSFPLHFWFYDPVTLRRLVEKHGFEPAWPAVTTTRHHAASEWISRLKNSPMSATRDFLRFLVGSVGSPDGGDVLRMVARRRAH